MRMSEMKIPDSTKVILLDIEGTTTSIKFVKDVLFPFVRKNLTEYLNAQWTDQELQDDIEDLRKQAEEDESNEKYKIPASSGDGEPIKNSVVVYVNHLMDLDRKTTSLKQLQGHIWRKAYSSGKIKGHVYNDVEPAFKRWTEKGIQICIYSSGSEEAQKLLFGYSECGDLLRFISNHYDTKIGAKVEESSYEKIAKNLKVEASKIVFFTDVPKEAFAATKGGMTAILVEREGNAPLTENDRNTYLVIKSFENI